MTRVGRFRILPWQVILAGAGCIGMYVLVICEDLLRVSDFRLPVATRDDYIQRA